MALHRGFPCVSIKNGASTSPSAFGMHFVFAPYTAFNLHFNTKLSTFTLQLFIDYMTRRVDMRIMPLPLLCALLSIGSLVPAQAMLPGEAPCNDHHHLAVRGLSTALAPELKGFIARLPKAELHVHIEGTLEPELMWRLARRNRVKLPYASLEEAKAARGNYTSLGSFLQQYYAGMEVLLREEDFYDLADAYLARAAAENVRRAEIFFDPQAHLSRGVPFSTFFTGLLKAVHEAEAKHTVSAALIMCALRDLGPQAALALLREQAAPYVSDILGIGLDSAEVGFPGSIFNETFALARKLGLHRVAHAGEEAGPDYVWAAIRSLGVERIDHGVHSLDDPKLVKHLVKTQLPLTTCPLSNVELKVYAGIVEQKYRSLLASGMAITINSDDPAYFLGYINANYEWAAQVAGLSPRQLAGLAIESFKASFIEQEAKGRYIQEVEAVLQAWLQRRRGDSGFVWDQFYCDTARLKAE